MHIICISFPGMKPDPFVYLFPALEGTDVTTRKFKFAVVGLTFVVYALILLAVYLASLLSVNFKSLSDVEKFTWCARLMKVFFFPFPILTGFWYLAVDGTLRNDVVNGTSKTSFIALYMWFGFYILDGSLAALAKLLFGRSYSTALFVHHVGVLITYGGAIFYNGKAHYFVMLGFLFEMAGPLTYINWVLGRAKLDHLPIWRLIQRVSIYLWHIRIVLGLYIFYVCIVNWHYIWADMPLLIIVCILLSTFVMLVLTTHWTEKETKRMYRLYRSYSRKALEFVRTTSRRKIL